MKHEFVIIGSDDAQLAAMLLISRSASFSCMPLPDDAYKFTVNRHEGHVEALARVFTTTLKYDRFVTQ